MDKILEQRISQVLREEFKNPPSLRAAIRLKEMDVTLTSGDLMEFMKTKTGKSIPEDQVVNTINAMRDLEN